MKLKETFHSLQLLILVIGLSFFSCDDSDLIDRQKISDSKLNDQELKKEVSIGIDISEDIAETVALNYITKTDKKSNKSHHIKSLNIIKDYNNETAVYAFNIEPKGFVLVSSNTKNVPVIAYSDENDFELNENSPDALKSWLAMTIIINNELEKVEKPFKEIEKQWSELIVVNGAPSDEDEIIIYSHTVNQQYGPLLQTTWGQNAPYSHFTPNNWPTGCVAVATAQVMRFHQWPSSFSWSIMPNNPPSSSTSAGSLEIAELMADIGNKVNMNYTANGSGAYTSDARNALVNNYQYSSQAYFANYNFNTTKSEIIANRPVIMDGYHTYYTTTSGWWIFKKTTHHYEDGHTWVCDGYKQQYDIYIHNPNTYYEYTTQENRYEWLHMNWGWNSAGNGWFYNNSIYVGNVYIDVNGTFVHPNFIYKRNCIYKIKQ